jgi:DNA invertase Pin-like site-specific DNA recombinase
MNTTPLRTAIYARVSTDDKGQDPENQLRELRAWALAKGYPVIEEYVDHASGRKGADKRKRFAALFEDAHKRKFDLVLFWALDRFSREGMKTTVRYLDQLDSYGVAFTSYTEPLLSTENELVRDILLAVMAGLAKVEAQKISDRTKAGMITARKKGKQIGRPVLDPDLQRKIAKLGAKGQSAYAIGKALGIDRKTAARYAGG